MTATKVTYSNRDLWDAFEAMAALVSQGWPDSRTALRLGRTFRKLREGREGIEETRTMLLNEYAAKADDGGYARDTDGTIRLRDPKPFGDEWRKLLQDEAEIEVFPVKLSALVDGKKKKGRCKECNRPLSPNLNALQLEVLVHIGAIEDDTPDDDKNEE